MPDSFDGPSEVAGISAGFCCDLVLSSRMSRSALILALGLFAACFPVAAQQPKHSLGREHPIAESGVTPLNTISHLSIYRPNATGAFESILFHNGPVRAWSDGGQLVSENAFVQIGMAPLRLFPATYLAPGDAAPASIRKPGTPEYRSTSLAGDGKELSAEMLNSPLSRVYCTGEVGFMYGQWSGKGSGDYVGSYIWGQAGNDKFQISAGASFDNWNGNSPKNRAYLFSR
jgi:hypothetical protein